jgi:hypothetical protein
MKHRNELYTEAYKEGYADGRKAGQAILTIQPDDRSKKMKSLLKCIIEDELGYTASDFGSEGKKKWDELLARIDARHERESVDWQPFNTAPKDGKAVLLHWDWEPMTVVAYYGKHPNIHGQDRRQCWRCQWDATPFIDKATHWMLLPNAPDAQRRG